jgi:hypothetical protein
MSETARMTRAQGKSWQWMALAAAVAMVGAIASQLRADARPALQTKTQSFDADPNWEARFNFVNYHPAQHIRQNYGFEPTAGEIGGDVWRSYSRPSWYAMVLPQLTLKDALRIDGRFRVTQMDLPVDVPGVRTLSGFHNASDYFIGFFNSERQGWRPQNWLGVRFRALRLPGKNGSALVECTYTTKTWRTGPAPTTSKAETHIEPDNQWHPFTIDYDPAGNRGSGTLTLTVDGKTSVGNLWPNHKIRMRFSIASASAATKCPAGR